MHGRNPVMRDFDNSARPLRRQIEKAFGSWRAALQAAKLAVPSRGSDTRVEVPCGHCFRNLLAPAHRRASKSGQVFCSNSCSAKYHRTGYNHTVETIARIQSAALLKPTGFVIDPSKAYRRPKTVTAPRPCKVCRTVFLPTRGTNVCCSTRCRRKTSGGMRLGAGATRSGWFRGIWCDSSYELAFAIFCLDQGMAVERNTDSWAYVDIKGDAKRYYPDFRVNGVLHEIKGIERPNDPLKLACVSEPLVYLKGEAGNAEHLDYVCLKYKVTRATLHSLYDESRHVFQHACDFCSAPFHSLRSNSVYCSRRCAGRSRSAAKFWSAKGLMAARAGVEPA